MPKGGRIIMAKCYEICGADVDKMVLTSMKKQHREIAEEGVTVQCIFVFDGSKHSCLSLHGYPAAAVVRRTSLKDRAKGMADAEIVIDKVWWDAASTDQQEALIDHELEHLELALDANNAVKEDDLGRPKLKLKPHDWQLGGFASIVKRHGSAACEFQMAKAFKDEFGQLLMFAEAPEMVG
jgi:hypothetical protein